MVEKEDTLSKNTELGIEGRDLIEVGAGIRSGELEAETAVQKVGDFVKAKSWVEQATTLIRGMEADARCTLKELLDADALGEAAVAANEALAIIELREDLARFLIALRVRPDAPSPALAQTLGQLEDDVLYVIRWLDKQVFQTELPVRLPRILHGQSLPADLVALAWRMPERWWLGCLLLAPIDLDEASRLLEEMAAKDGIRLKKD